MSESKAPVPKIKPGQQRLAGGMLRSARMKITELNPHLVCALCSGYLVDATTIIECLHSYCRTCIVRHFEKEKKCPICSVKVHKTKPHLNIRSDKTLQNLVYKVVPNLFKDEMKRRKMFYSDNSQASTSKSTQPPPEDNKMETNVGENAFVIFTEDEHISLSLEYYLPTTRKMEEQGESSGGDEANQTRKRTNVDSNVSEELVDKRYLRCPAAVSVSHIKKFIRHKFSLPMSYQIEIMHKDGGDTALRDEYTLMDVAYIYHWKRNCQLQLLYRVYEPAKRLKLSTTTVSVNSPTTSQVSKPNTTTRTTTSKGQASRNVKSTPSAGTPRQVTKDSSHTEEPVPMVS
ncbi:polycomb complex protein BMI-1-like isoform X2 [Amphiura filiformis]|uniref:polycomb complex protein BMI-1-like isoform X2 n=1 Tax=Amphiura filiformis TaxID=82378 RepID=UPI003B21EEEE